MKTRLFPVSASRRYLVCKCATVGVVAIVLYVLSIGPVLRLSHVKPYSSGGPWPRFIEVIYYPILHLPSWEPYDRFMEHYVRWWISDE